MKILKISLSIALFLLVINSCSTVQRTACPSFKGKGEVRSAKHSTKTSWKLDFKQVSALNNKRHKRSLKNNLTSLTPLSGKNQIEALEQIPVLPNPNPQENRYLAFSTDGSESSNSVNTQNVIPVQKIENKHSFRENVRKAVKNRSGASNLKNSLLPDDSLGDININALLGFIFSLLGLLVFPLLLPVGIVFSIIGLNQTKGAGKGSGRDLAWAGLIIGIFGVLVYAAIIALYIFLLTTF